MKPLRAPLRAPLRTIVPALVLPFAIVPLAACAGAPRATASVRAEPVLDRILETARTDNRAYDHLRVLCKTIGPRLTGTAGYDRAAAWAVAQFRSFGLDARLEPWGEFPTVFERGYGSGGMVAPDSIDYTFQTRAWSPGTGGPKRGHAVLEPSSDEELEALKPHLAGAWVVQRSTAAPTKLARELREACEAAGVLGFVRPGGKSGRLHMGGNYRVAAEKIRPEVQVQLLQAQHADLEARLLAGEAVELEFDVGNKLAPGPVSCANVVADWKGREHPEEIVLVGGHLDSWDGAEGAQDNGTGCATAIEAARILAASGARPRRTIRFVLFGGEEQGLLGSTGYVKAHEDELARTSIALIHDGGGTAIAGLGTSYAMLEDFQKVFAPVASLEPAFPFHVRETEGLTNTGDSDHAPFLQAGVPGFFWSQSEKGYERVHHTQFDVFESVDQVELAHSALVVAVAAFGFAELDHLLDRTDMEEIPRRRMGVSLQGTTVQDVFKSGRAASASWEAGDRILSIDGVDVATRDEVTDALQLGGPKKVFRIQRGEQVVESTIDWSDERSEQKRTERAQRREAWQRAHGAN